MDNIPNKQRGEIELKLGSDIYILRPEHGRVAKLDAVLDKGVLGTMLGMTNDSHIKTRDLALCTKVLSASKDELDTIEHKIFDSGIMSVAATIVTVLTSLSAGGKGDDEDEGKQEPQ